MAFRLPSQILLPRKRKMPLRASLSTKTSSALCTISRFVRKRVNLRACVSKRSSMLMLVRIHPLYTFQVYARKPKPAKNHRRTWILNPALCLAVLFLRPL